MGLNKRLIDQAGGGAVQPTDNFNIVTYTGDGTSSRGITGVGFQPDLVIIKNRGRDDQWSWADSVRGGSKWIASDSTQAETTNANAAANSFDSDGFTVSGNFDINRSGYAFCSWSFKGGGVPTPNNNTQGTITSTVSANPDAGFSIVKYTGTDTGNETVGHGLLQKPELVIYKNLDEALDWVVYSAYLSTPEYYHLKLNTTDPQTYNLSMWDATDLTSSVLQLGSTDNVNSLNKNHIAYCFHSVDGYQKVGSYTGNGSSGGQTITGLGFNPRFLLVKHAAAPAGWRITDSVRGDNTYLYPNLTNPDDSNSGYTSLITDGFRLNGLDSNASGTYIYLAIA